MLTKVITYMAMVRTIVFLVTQAHEIRELRILPVGVVEEKDKLRAVYNSTFVGQATVREGRGVGVQGAFQKPEGRLVNADTD